MWVDLVIDARRALVLDVLGLLRERDGVGLMLRPDVGRGWSTTSAGRHDDSHLDHILESR